MKTNTTTTLAALLLPCNIPLSSYARSTLCFGKKGACFALLQWQVCVQGWLHQRQQEGLPLGIGGVQ